MYVYVMKFEKYPHLIKIGKSNNPESRARTLSRYHGDLLEIDYYHIGEEEDSVVESFLHRSFGEFNSKEPAGDGCTEFFSDAVQDRVKEYLHKYASNNSVAFQQQIMRDELFKEEVRYKNLIALLLGYDCAKTHYDGSHAIYTGWMDLIHIESCLSMGYQLEDISSRYISKPKEHYRRYRYTTPKRVSMAYILHKQGSLRFNKLKEEVDSFSLPELRIRTYAELPALAT